MSLERSLPRDAYIEPAFLERERAAIFAREWFAAGRGEQLPHTGSFRVVDVAGESVIIVRGADGLHAHLNLCRHRGSRLLCGDGTLRGAIVCPYHAWSYAPDGALTAAPFIERSALPADVQRLHSVEVAEWGGFVFVRLISDAEAPDFPAPDSAPPTLHAASAGRSRAQRALLAQLGPVAERVARYPLAQLRTAHSIRYQVAANWKVLLENYNECYHCAGVHPELCRIVPAFKHHGGAGLDWENGVPHRPGATTFTHAGTTTRAAFPGLDEFERVRHKGELIYPNLLLSLCADHVAAFTIWPIAPAQTAVVCDFLFHPDELARAAFDPRDAVEFWDLVNRQDWKICESVQAGMTSRAFRFGYYAPMEDASLDIRRYIARHVGDDAVHAP
jgi:Rieske 2Fe-2S family protein